MPINKVCFVLAKIVKTNEVYVKIDDWLIQKSAFDAQETLNNKISSIFIGFHVFYKNRL